MFKESQFETVREYGHDFLELTPEKSQELKARIEKWHGLVRMFVHPMFEKWRGHNDPSKVKLVQIEQVLAKLLAMPEEKTPPVIIMEEVEYVSKLQEWLKENPAGSSQSGVYFVKTLSDFSTPYSKDRVDYEDCKEAWNKLIKTLDNCGVKKILMAGQQLEVSPRGINEFGEETTDWTGKDPFVERCVGMALAHLSKDKGGKFEVKLSGLIEPGSARRYFNSFKQKS